VQAALRSPPAVSLTSSGSVAFPSSSASSLTTGTEFSQHLPSPASAQLEAVSSPSQPRVASAAGAAMSPVWMHGCRSVDVFKKLNKVQEGTYGVVYRSAGSPSPSPLYRVAR
jgi:hypothetical protein